MYINYQFPKVLKKAQFFCKKTQYFVRYTECISSCPFGNNEQKFECWKSSIFNYYKENYFVECFNIAKRSIECPNCHSNYIIDNMNNFECIDCHHVFHITPQMIRDALIENNIDVEFDSKNLFERINSTKFTIPKLKKNKEI